MCLQLYSMEIISSLLTLIITTHYRYLVSCHLICRTMVKSILNTYEYILKILALHKFSDPHLKCQGLKNKLYHTINGETRKQRRGRGRNQVIREFAKSKHLIRVRTKWDRNQKVNRNAEQRSATLKHVCVASIKLTSNGICLGQV